MNSVNLIGRLTKDPESRRSKDMEVATFTLAVDRPGKDSGTDFIRCVAFGKSAEFAEDYFTKGLRVGVSGRIQTGSYENKDGDTVYTTDVIIDRLDFADGVRNPEDKEEKRDDKRSRRR